MPDRPQLLALVVRIQTHLLPRGRLDRGDVPGWVLITLMTAGLVTLLWGIAGPRLGQILGDALESVKGPAGG